MIQMKNLSFHYGKLKEGQSGGLFHNINLSIPEGHIYGLLGKNGAGKSTLLKLLTGLVFPHSGECQVIGYQSSKREPDFLSEIYLIPEEFYVPNVSGEVYVKMYAPFYPRFNHSRFEELVQEFELPFNQKLNQYSLGQKKKFLIAFGIATETKLLILDEPTNGLDIPSKSQFRRMLASSIYDNRIFIISTHQVHDLENLIDAIVILNQGKIIFHQQLDSIAQRLLVSLEHRKPEDALYYEQVLGGYAVMRENHGQDESKIDLELLFNAVTTKQAPISQIFKQESL